MSENCVGKVESDSDGTEIKRHEHVPDVINRTERLQIFFVVTGDASAVFEPSIRVATEAFDWDDA